MEAFDGQGLFENGLNAIQTDELHCYEEGIQVLGQCLLLDYGNPRHMERAMETSRALIGVTGINQAGHRHFISSYFSGTKIWREDPWQSSKPRSYLILHPAYMLARYNGNPQVTTFIVEMAD